MSSYESSIDESESLQSEPQSQDASNAFQGSQENISIKAPSDKIQPAQVTKLEFDQVKCFLKDICGALTCQADTFFQFSEYFNLDLQPLNRCLSKLTQKITEMDGKFEIDKPKLVHKVPAVKPRLYDGLQKELDKIIEKKINNLKDLQRQQGILSSQFESMNYKSKLVEQRLIALAEEISERPRRRELQDTMDNFKQYQSQIILQFKNVVEKEQVKQIEYNIAEMRSQLEKRITTQELNQTLTDKLVNLENQIKQFGDASYASKGDTVRKLDELDTFVKGQFSSMMLFKSSAQIKLDQLQDNYQKIQVEMLFKVKQEDFDKFKKYAADYLHRDEIKDIYQYIIPRVQKMQEEVQSFQERLNEFQKFLSKTDYDVLYKASKMDFEMLAQGIEQKQYELAEKYEQISTLQLQFDKLKEYIQEFYKINQSDLLKQTKDLIIFDLQDDISSKVEQVFGMFNVPQLQHDLQSLCKSLDTKASKQDLVSIFENKSSKLSVETLAKVLTTHQCHLKMITLYVQQFMDLFSGQFDLESLNFKRVETSKIATEILQLMKKLDGTDINVIFERPILKIETTQDEMPTKKLQKRTIGTPGPQKGLLRPLIVNQREGVLHTNPSFTSPERRAKSQEHRLQRAKNMILHKN